MFFNNRTDKIFLDLGVILYIKIYNFSQTHEWKLKERKLGLAVVLRLQLSMVLCPRRRLSLDFTNEKFNTTLSNVNYH